jgi:hypothetical protein
MHEPHALMRPWLAQLQRLPVRCESVTRLLLHAMLVQCGSHVVTAMLVRCKHAICAMLSPLGLRVFGQVKA